MNYPLLHTQSHGDEESPTRALIGPAATRLSALIIHAHALIGRNTSRGTESDDEYQTISPL